MTRRFALLTSTAMAAVWAPPDCFAQAQRTWTEVAGLYPVELAPRGAWDSVRRRTVAIARTNTRELRVLEWDGTTWFERPTASRPPNRISFDLAFDQATGQTVLFGGEGPSGNLRDTWTWDGSDWLARSSLVTPPARLLHRLAYDPVRQRVVLFGGRTSPGNQLGDTWTWDGRDWTAMSPSTAPSPRSEHEMAWDPASQRVLLFGGITAVGLSNETWAWDGTDWTLLNPTTSPPAPSVLGMETDFTANRVVAYLRAAAATIPETWNWDGATWTRVMTNSRPPGPPHTTMFAYDGNTRGVLGAFGTTTPVPQRTMSFDGTDWTLTDAHPLPNLGRVSTDSVRDRVMLYSQIFNDDITHWEWDGRAWRAFIASPAPDPSLAGVSLAFDEGRAVTVLFGSRALTPAGETWEWDGTTWTRRAAQSGPPPRLSLGMAYDRIQQQCVMFGGRPLNGQVGAPILRDTWTWDGAIWTQRLPSTSPPPSLAGAMVWDDARQTIVLVVAPQTAPGTTQTWLWDGADWNPVTSANNPPPNALTNPALAYDPERRVVVFREGQNIWTFDGVDWTLEQTIQANRFLGLAWDPTHDRMIGVEALDGDVWVLGPPQTAQVSRFGSGCAGTSGVPALSTLGLPGTMRRRFALELTGARPNAAALIQVGLGAAGTSLPFGSCTLLAATNPGFTVPIGSTNGGGFAQQDLPIPTDTTLFGATFVAQALVLDPNGGGSGLIAASNGVQFGIGF